MVNWEEKTAMELKTGSHNGLPLVSSPTRSLSGYWLPLYWMRGRIPGILASIGLLALFGKLLIP